MVQVYPIERFVLAHSNMRTQYEFLKQDDSGQIIVVHTTGRTRSSYTLPVEEARQLWRSLRAKGYERF